MQRIGGFLAQLKRRGVLASAVAYVVSAWLIIEGASVLTDAFAVPEIALQLLFALLVLGFPAVLVFSWFFDIRSDGITRTKEDVSETPHHLFDRRIGFAIISLLVAALALSIYGNVRQAPEAPRSVSILIADFANSTGSELFSGIVEESLRVGLEVAPFVQSFPRTSAVAIAADIDSTEEGDLLIETANLVALREGVNIVIGGSLRRDEDGLQVMATGYAPGDQSELFSVTEYAETDANILDAVAEVSRQLRRALGDTEKPTGAGESETFIVANLEAAAEYLKAQDLQLSRKLEEAVVHYEKAIALDPTFARAYAGLALTEEYLGRSEAAGPHWEAALAGLSTLTERGQLRTLGNYYTINKRDYDKALETYERLVERYPVDNVAYNNLGVAAFYAMDFQRALEVGRVVASRYPAHSGYAANLALYAMYASRFDEAEDVADSVVEVDPSSAYAHFVLAQSHAVAGRLDKAAETYTKMKELDEFAKSVSAEGLADLALNRGDVDEALETLDAAIAYEVARGATTTAAIKHTMRIDAYRLSGDTENAIAAAITALDMAPNDPAVSVPAAIALIELSEFERAQLIIDSLSKGFSKTRRAYAEALRAQLASAHNEHDVAAAAADAAIELADLWLIRLIRANVLLDANRIPEAQADLRACEERIGEGIAVFLNDRPSLRTLRSLEAAVAKSGL